MGLLRESRDAFKGVAARIKTVGSRARTIRERLTGIAQPAPPPTQDIERKVRGWLGEMLEEASEIFEFIDVIDRLLDDIDDDDKTK